MAINFLDPLNRKSRFSDFILNTHFHVMDVSFTLPVVLTPVYGFRTATAPELSLNTKDVKEGNYEHPRPVIKDASVPELTLTQGVRWGNSDFYDWSKSAVSGAGAKTYRKKLLLVQFSQIATSQFSGVAVDLFAGAGALAAAGTNLAFGDNGGDLVQRIPARAWMLYDCIPVRYKAGSDFDPMGSEVSIAELSIKYVNFTEFNTGI